MKMKSLLAGIALGAVAAFGMATTAQARVDFFIDTGDYWRHHHHDYCYFHDCGDSWYRHHHRHFWRERDSWDGGGHHGDGDWHDHDGDHDGDHGGDDDDGGHHHHHDHDHD